MRICGTAFGDFRADGEQDADVADCRRPTDCRRLHVAADAAHVHRRAHHPDELIQVQCGGEPGPRRLSRLGASPLPPCPSQRALFAPLCGDLARLVCVSGINEELESSQGTGDSYARRKKSQLSSRSSSAAYSSTSSSSTWCGTRGWHTREASPLRRRIWGVCYERRVTRWRRSALAGQPRGDSL